MRRYLIHIGPHKTGTTYVQMRLAAGRGQLRDCGVEYPTVWCAAENAPSHLGFFGHIRDRSLDMLRGELAALPADSLVVVSSEDLQYLDEQEVRLLADVLATPEVTILYYLRRWSDLLPSIWQERIKHGGEEMLPDFLAMMMRHAPQSPLTNYGIVLDRYVTVFGAARVRVVSYSEVADAHVDLADHLAITFLPPQLGTLPSAPVAQPNASLAAVDMELIRALNAIHRSVGGGAGGGIHAWLKRYAGSLDLSAITAAMNVEMTTATLTDDTASLAPLHQELFRKYHDLMVPPISRGRLFRPSRRVISFVRTGYLADPAIASRMREIHRLAYST